MVPWRTGVWLRTGEARPARSVVRIGVENCVWEDESFHIGTEKIHLVTNPVSSRLNIRQFYKYMEGGIR